MCGWKSWGPVYQGKHKPYTPKVVFWKKLGTMLSTLRLPGEQELCVDPGSSTFPSLTLLT